MDKIKALLFAAITFFSLHALAQSPYRNDRVYTGNQVSNTVSVIDPSQNKLLGEIKLGNPYPLEATDGWYYVQLGPASASGPFDPSGYYYVGGDPWLIVQQGVAADTEVLAPSLAS